MVRDNPETNPITTKPETTSHVAEQFSWVPLPYCSLPGCSFPIKISCCVRHVSLDNSFPSARQEPSFGPWKGSSFLQQHQIYHFTANRWGKMETGIDFIFLGSKITVDSDFSHQIKRHILWKKSYDKPREYTKKQRHHFANKGLYS